MRLDGRVAIVAGGGQTPGDTIGNGRATAILFAREGAKVVVVDRDAASARETQSLVEHEGGTAFSIEADVTDESACQTLVATCVDTYGRIDILHNNVGIGTGDGEIAELSVAAWERIMEVNLKSAFLMCKHALPVMRNQKSGAIVNVSSLAAVAAAVELTAYKVSKAGLNALTHVLAIGNAPYGIRVNAIMPGLIETPFAIEGVSQKYGVSKEELVRQRAAPRQDGHGVGCCLCGAVSCFGRGSFYHRRGSARRWRTSRANRLRENRG